MAQPVTYSQTTGRLVGSPTQVSQTRSASKGEKSTTSGPESDFKFANNPYGIDTSIFTRRAQMPAIYCCDESAADFYGPNVALMVSVAVEGYIADVATAFDRASRAVKAFRTSPMRIQAFERVVSAVKWHSFVKEFVYITMALGYQADIAAGRKTRGMFLDIMKIRDQRKVGEFADVVDGLNRALGKITLSPQFFDPVVQFIHDLIPEDDNDRGDKAVVPLDIKLRIQLYVSRLVWLLIEFWLHLTEQAGMEKADKSSSDGSEPVGEENGGNAHDNTASKQDESSSPAEKHSPAQASQSSSSSTITPEEEDAVFDKMTQDFLEILAFWFEKMALISIEFLFGLEKGTQEAIHTCLKAKIAQLLHICVLTPPQFGK